MTRLFRLTLMLLVLGHVALDCVAAQDQFFDSNGVRIRYVDQGSGPPVVLIHGFSGESRTKLGRDGRSPESGNGLQGHRARLPRTRPERQAP